MTTTLTINVNTDIKKRAQILTQQEGTTLTFLINQFLKLYTNQEIKFSLIKKEEEDFINLSHELTGLARKKIKINKLVSLSEQLKDL